MIEREFVSEKIKHFKIRELIDSKIRKFAGVGQVDIERTPLGEKIIIHAVRPGLIIGTGGETVKDLTETLKRDFKLENPQIEIREVVSPSSNAKVVAKKIASDMERFGPQKFKLLGYRCLTDIMKSGALGAEIKITGVGLPGSRAKSWRFFAGLMKKSGDVAREEIERAIEVANLKKGTVGINVAIMPGDAKLPDRVYIHPAEIKVEALKGPEVEAEIKQIEAVIETAKAVEEEPKKAKATKKAAPKKAKKTKEVETSQSSEQTS